MTIAVSVISGKARAGARRKGMRAGASVCASSPEAIKSPALSRHAAGLDEGKGYGLLGHLGSWSLKRNAPAGTAGALSVRSLLG